MDFSSPRGSLKVRRSLVRRPWRNLMVSGPLKRTTERDLRRDAMSLFVKLTARAVNCARFREAALALYSLFRTPGEEEEVNRRIIDNKSELQKLLAHNVSIPKLQTLADAAQTLYSLQQDNSGQEFGANLVFHQPARFLVNASFEDGDLWGESTNVKPDEELPVDTIPIPSVMLSQKHCQVSSMEEAKHCIMELPKIMQALTRMVTNLLV
ncbi:U5 small nuclear ribonucleoprotein helicase [Artemisia annua]|uniref:U5 small nuclear ribonucleoprotein helicase n=1 Tax=Artemisia annua TaxID=35608 RepID=A0A2U1LA50_ARTAN|nr:U5 small nuclear ribonucleoprotein helicase [Artemisia annua]